jgi:hypothetical protein
MPPRRSGWDIEIVRRALGTSLAQGADRREPILGDLMLKTPLQTLAGANRMPQRSLACVIVFAHTRLTAKGWYGLFGE